MKHLLLCLALVSGLAHAQKPIVKIPAKTPAKPLPGKPATAKIPAKPVEALKVMPPDSHSGRVSEVQLSADGQWAVTASYDDGQVRLWEVETGRTARVIDFAKSADNTSHSVYCSRWLSDNRRILIGGANILELWDIVNGQKLRSWDFPDQVGDDGMNYSLEVRHMEIGSDGKRALVMLGGVKGAAKIVDLTTGNIVRDFGAMQALKFAFWSADGASVWLLQESTRSSNWRRFNALSGAELSSVSVAGVATCVSADRKLVFVPGDNFPPQLNLENKLPFGITESKAAILDVASGKPVQIFEAGRGIGAAFSPDSKWLVWGGSEGELKAIEVASGKIIAPRPELQRGIVVEATKDSPAHNGGIEKVAFRADGKALVSSGTDQVARVWSWPDFAPQKRLRGWALNPSLVRVAPDGKRALIFSDGGQGSIRAFDLASGRTLSEIPYATTIKHAVFAPDGQSAFLASNQYEAQNEVRRFDLRSGELSRPLYSIKDDIRAISLSPNGRYLLANKVLVDTTTGRVVREFEVDIYPDASAFRSDGNVVFAARSALVVCDSNSGQVLSNHKIGEQKLPGLDSLDFYVEDFEKSAVFINNGNSILQPVKFNPSGDQYGEMTSIAQRNCASGKIENLWPGFSQKSYISGLRLHPDGKTALLFFGDNTQNKREWQVRDVTNGAITRVLPASASGAGPYTVINDTNLMFSTKGDNTLLVHGSDGKTLFTYLTLENGDWLAFLPDGRFDGSPGGIERVYFSQGDKTFGIEQFSERFYQPGLIPLVLSGTGLAPSLNAGAILAQGAPPSVQILSPKTGNAAGEIVEIAVQAKAQNGGEIKAIRLYHNGRLVGGPSNLRSIIVEAPIPQNNAAGELKTEKFSVELSPGENSLRAVAYSQNDLESAPAEIFLDWKAPPAKLPTLHVLVVGINAYKDSSMNLAYAKPDAQAMSDFFDAKKAGFAGVQITRLLDAAATRQNIETALQKMATQSTSNDVALVYLAGHGETAAATLALDKDENAPQTFYFLPADAGTMTLKQLVRETGLSGPRIDELVSKIPARKVLMIYDACKSGAAVDNLTRATASEQQALALLARSQGIYVLTASNAQQYASEVRALGHGLLTYALLEGLGGKAAAKGERSVRVQGLLDYSQTRVPALSREYRGREQFPIVYGRGPNFPLAAQ